MMMMVKEDEREGINEIKEKKKKGSLLTKRVNDDSNDNDR